MVEIHERVGGPQLAAELLASDDLLGMDEEHLQDSQRLILKPDLDALLAQFSGAHVQLERAEADDLRTGRFVVHPGCVDPPLCVAAYHGAKWASIFRFLSETLQHNLMISFTYFGG